MSYLPSFTGNYIFYFQVKFISCVNIFPSTSDDNRFEPGLDLADMDRQVMKCRAKSIEYFQEQSILYKRMQREIIHLKAITTSQQTIINQLEAKCDLLLKQKLDIGNRPI